MSIVTRSLDSLQQVVEDYDLYLFDQWGVVHDGHSLYRDVINTLRNLRQVADKTMIVLSNSSRRAAHSAELMKKMGLDPALWDEIITSGEHCLSCLRDRPAGLYASLGRRFYLISWPEGYNLPEGYDYQATGDIACADFILLTGIAQPADAYVPLLQKALARNLPMICANPDLLSPEGGKIKPCPGQVALLYKKMGGILSSHGKPAKELYELILQKYPTAKNRVLAIGDSLEHDIQGANNIGIDSLLLTQGIHGHEWQALLEDGASINQASALLGKRHNVQFTYVATGLCW